MTIARALAQWTHAYRATPDDLALAERALVDTVAAALLDGCPGFDSFTDDAVRRPAAQTLVDRVHADMLPGGTSSLLDGRASLRIALADGSEVRTESALPSGAPGRPPSEADLRARAAACGPDVPAPLDGPTCTGAVEVLRKHFPYVPYEGHAT